MRGFIVLCLSAVAIAAPQGYNYNPTPIQQSGGFSGSNGLQQSAGFGGHSGQQSAGFNGGQGVQQSSGFSGVQGVQQSSGFSGAQISQQSGGFLGGQSSQQSGGFLGGQSAVSHHQQQQQQQQQAVVTKRFFIHSAPEDVEEDYKEKHITVGVPKKNYNVVFIKAPAKSNKKTSIKISPATNEEKTVIYVLSRKTDSSDVQAEVLEHQAVTTKPEVFFIKYKTNEEATHAQEQIQAQYDSLGGSSQITDEGVAPVTSVIGSLGGGDSGADNGSGFAGGAVSGQNVQGAATSTATGSHANANNAYLPPNFY